MKPWLLMTKEEKENRIDLYHEFVFHTFPIDEGLIVMVRPPRDKLGALFELWLHQCREKGSRRSLGNEEIKRLWCNPASIPLKLELPITQLR